RPARAITRPTTCCSCSAPPPGSSRPGPLRAAFHWLPLGSGHVITRVMSRALVKSSSSKSNAAGIIPAACTPVIPGLGQLVNGDTDKAIGVFAVSVITGASLLGAIPPIGPVDGLLCGATWLYGVADGFLEGRKKR